MAADTDINKPASAAILRSEMGPSPDESLNETINLFADYGRPVAKSITRLSDGLLADLQATVESELGTRSPAGRGATAFSKAFRRKSRERKARVDVVTDMLELVDGAVIEFFDRLDIDTDATYSAVSEDGTFMRGQMTLRAGRLKIVVVARYSDDMTMKASTVRGRILSRWGRTLATFDGDDPDPNKATTDAIASFAHWAATQHTEE